MSTFKFDKWYNAAGQPMNAVLQLQHTYWSAATTTTSEIWTDCSGSTVSLIARGNNSKFLIRYLPQCYKESTDQYLTGGGFQICRSAPAFIELWNPYSTWGVCQHLGFAAGSGIGGLLQFIDAPNVAAGTTVSYKLRMAKYTSNNTYTSGTLYHNYAGTWNGYTSMSLGVVMEIQGD